MIPVRVRIYGLLEDIVAHIKSHHKDLYHKVNDKDQEQSDPEKDRGL